VSGGVFWVFYTHVWHFLVTAVHFSKNDHNSVLQGKKRKNRYFFFSWGVNCTLLERLSFRLFGARQTTRRIVEGKTTCHLEE
jgi:hypothetical protein